MKKTKVHVDDQPWVTVEFKQLIKHRQRAFFSGNIESFNHYRNVVNRERKALRGRYFNSKVKELKQTKPSQWWSAVKRIAGMTPASGAESLLSNLKFDGVDNLSKDDVANTINEAFLHPMQPFKIIEPSTPSEDDTEQVILSESVVMSALAKVNSRKAPGPDGIPNWVLKEYADILAQPITSIINCSFAEQKCPSQWKMANVVPIPKQKPVVDINKHLRPVSLTPSVSKLAEDFVVSLFIGPAVLKIIDPDQFGAIPKSSTLYALTSMLHHWSQATDGTGASVRVVLFDYRKAFDLIDHTLLVQKIFSLSIPRNIASWVADFLTNRKQRVKLSSDRFSEWGPVPAGVPQGTKLGPWLFILMINDLRVADVNTWKYVDDTTIAEILPRTASSNIQDAVNTVQEWSNSQLMQLNADKCKEMRIDFKKEKQNVNPIEVNGKILSHVNHAKILGLHISNDLKWNTHVGECIKKANKRLYFLVQLKRASVDMDDIINFYCTAIRPVLEYCSPVYHHSLAEYLSDDMERVQKRALSIITRCNDYQQNLAVTGLEPLKKRRTDQCARLFKKIIDDRKHKLVGLLPKEHQNTYNMRKNRPFVLPICKTNRFKNAFIPAMCSNINM